ncbi:uncharacterized protein G2W53_026868 [Senna tora]|uniref:Uncharacterized protein n=1 Tax=Senna tora TaxID=362788 RepID=A0A834TFR6_9FABA|nr:uncharacterized protein G2W53_026868 [Senna tora]
MREAENFFELLEQTPVGSTCAPLALCSQ